MSDLTTPPEDPNALLIGVNREKSGDGDNWYFVENWMANPIDPEKLPPEIRSGFTTLKVDDTVGAVAAGNDMHGESILLYLLNVPVLKKIFPAAGGQGAPIQGFRADLTHQTILVRGFDNSGAEIYGQITQKDWSSTSFAPSHWTGKIPDTLDGLITNTNLAVLVDPVLVAEPVAPINCYLLNLESFTDPPPPPRS